VTSFGMPYRATKEMDNPNARKKKLYSKLHLHSIHSLQNLVPQRRYLPTAEARGRTRGRQLSRSAPAGGMKNCNFGYVCSQRRAYYRYVHHNQIFEHLETAASISQLSTRKFAVLFSGSNDITIACNEKGYVNCFGAVWYGE
jgi:hypothetical protein